MKRLLYFHSFFSRNSNIYLQFLSESGQAFQTVDYMTMIEREHEVRAAPTLIAIGDDGQELGRLTEFDNWSPEALEGWLLMIGYQADPEPIAPPAIDPDIPLDEPEESPT